MYSAFADLFFADRQTDRNAKIQIALLSVLAKLQKKRLPSSCPFVRPFVLQPLTFAWMEHETLLSGNIRVASQKAQIVPDQLSLD
jgi:hypothetical protein